MLIFQGFDGIFGVRVVIFGVVESGEMLDFSGFYRSGYRSDFGGLGCDFWEIEFLKSRCGWNR